MISVSVFYASKDRQQEITLSVEENCSVALAIARSKIQDFFPEIQLATIQVGVFSKRVTLDTILKEGDRVEIYRPLVIDPKELRRLKAQQ